MVDLIGAEQWMADSLIITGAPLDEFSPAELMQSFGAWMMFTDEGPPVVVMSDVMIDLYTLVTGEGVTWDPARGTFQGGRLV
jgi:hypothetical protein